MEFFKSRVLIDSINPLIQLIILFHKTQATTFNFLTMSAMENAGILKLQIYELGFIKVLGKLESCPLEIAGGGRVERGTG